MVLRPLMQVLAALLSVYMLILFIRILLSWFQPRSLGKVYDIIYRITEPYLALFRRLRFLHTGRFDFSPIVAIISLVIVENIFLTLATYGQISFGIILALLVKAVWSAASFIIFFYIAIMLIRFFSLIISRNANSPGWQSLDALIQPMVFRFTRLVRPRTPLKYSTILGILSAVFVVAYLILRLLFRLLTAALASLPF